jgi:hypothetical protein
LERSARHLDLCKQRINKHLLADEGVITLDTNPNLTLIKVTTRFAASQSTSNRHDDERVDRTKQK